MEKKTLLSLDKMEEFVLQQTLKSRSPLAIIAGNYALDKQGNPGTEEGSLANFGIFSDYTFDVGAKLVLEGEKAGKKLKLALLVDDYSQMSNKRWFLEERTREEAIVDSYFSNFAIPDAYAKSLEKHNLTLDNLATSRQGPFFQESLYRRQFEQETSLPASCAGEYRLILEELSQQGFNSVLYFIPLVCQWSTCTALGYYGANKENFRLDVTHVYLSSNQELETPSELEQEMNERYGGIIVMQESPGRRK